MLCSAESRARPLRSVALLLAVLAVATAGCSTGGGGDAASTTTASPAVSATTAPATTTASITDDDPSTFTGSAWCPSTEAVAEVVGHAVNQSANAGGSGSVGISYSYEGCSYDGDDNSYSITRATITSDEDGSPFDLLDQDAQAALADSGFTAVEGLGDDAYLDGQTLVVRTGPTMVFLEVDRPDDQDVAADRNTLADDLMTIDLSDDATICTAPLAAVEYTFGPATEPRSGGGGVFVDDVSIQTTSCTFVTDDETKITLSVADAGSWDDWVAAKRSSTFTASYEASSIGEFAAFDNGEELFVDESDRPLRIASSMPDASTEDAMALRVALAELVFAG